MPRLIFVCIDQSFSLLLNASYPTALLLERLRLSVLLGMIAEKCAVTCDFQQCVILTSVDSDKPLQPLFKLRNSK